MTAKPLDLSADLFPSPNYFPFPALVPNRLGLHGSGPLKVADLRSLGACSGDGPDYVHTWPEDAPELSKDPDADAPPLVYGGMVVSRAVMTVSTGGLDRKPVRVASWMAVVQGLTFHADDQGRVYVDGPDGRIILFDSGDERWSERGYPCTVYAEEERGPGGADGPEWFPSGKRRRYESYAALVMERNAQLQRGTHGRVPDAIGSLMGIAPMIGSKRTGTIIGTDILEPDGLGSRRTGRRCTLRFDDATAYRLHGERGVGKQAVLRYDSAIEADAADIDRAALQLLSEFDTESMIAVVGVLMNAHDNGNKLVRIGAAQLANIRGKDLSRSSDKRKFRMMSELLSGAIIEVCPVNGDGQTARLNLFARQGEVVVPGGHRIPLVTVNEVLYRAMLAHGHGVFIDRRILSVDLNAYEWEARLNVALATQWALGWVRNGYATGKRLKLSAKVLMKYARIPYDFKAERTKRGSTAVRQRLANALDRLAGLGLDLKSWKRTKQDDDPSGDLYEFVPSDALACRLTRHRQPALVAKSDAAALPKPKPTKGKARRAF